MAHTLGHYFKTFSLLSLFWFLFFTHSWWCYRWCVKMSIYAVFKKKTAVACNKHKLRWVTLSQYQYQYKNIFAVVFNFFFVICFSITAVLLFYYHSLFVIHDMAKHLKLLEFLKRWRALNTFVRLLILSMFLIFFV